MKMPRAPPSAEVGATGSYGAGVAADFISEGIPH
jgi:hypothetical protein